MNKESIIAKLKELKIEHDPKEHHLKLYNLLPREVREAEEKAKDNKEGEGSAEKTNSNKKSENYFVWLKYKAYINETERMEAGVYYMIKVPARFSKLPSDVVEVFKGEVPVRKLAKMAEWVGVTHPEDFSDEELLEKVISEPKKL